MKFLFTTLILSTFYLSSLFAGAITFKETDTIKQVLTKFYQKSPKEKVYVSTLSGWLSGQIKKVGSHVLVLKEDSGKIDLNSQKKKYYYHYITLSSILTISNKRF